jgi:Zn-dependent M28 family amino/carboxypeptidase
MRTLATVAVVVSTLGVQVPSSPPAARPSDSITRQELRDHVFFLASDFLGGRRPDDSGFSVAAEYAACQFKAAGVRPAMTDAEGTPTYFQKVYLTQRTTRVDKPFTLKTPAGEQEFAPLDDLKLISAGPSLTDVPMVFVGYGISEPDYGWDDIKDTSLKGKVAVMLIGTPQRDGKPVLPDEIDRKYQSIVGLGRKASNPRLKENIPAALVVIADKEHAEAWDRLSTIAGETQLRYRPGPAPGRITVPPAAVALVKGTRAAAMFAGQEYDPAGVASRGLAGYRTFALKDVSLSLGLSVTGKDLESMNVVGVVPGTDPNVANQYVSVGAHLDHIPPGGSQIRNGADDNASGCAGVIEIAEAVALQPLRRPVLFCLWTAEESGLLGSRRFISAPPVPMDRVIVNINLDSIGRSDAASATTRTHYVVGSAQVTPDLKALIASVNARTVKWPLDFESQEESMRGSDHFSFHGLGIPTAFFFSGRPETLHAPTDDPETVDYEKVQRISQLAYEVTAELSNRDRSIRPPAGPVKPPMP